MPFMMAAPAASAQTGATWVQTGTQAMNLSNAVLQGPLSPSTPLRLVISLNLRNNTALNQYISAISTPGNALYGQYLTPTEFTADYGPTSEQVQLVTDYLSQQGFTNISVEPNNLMISADATAAQVEAAFNTQLSQFTQAGRTVYANTAAAEVPSSLSGIVGAVLGLNDASVMHSFLQTQATTLPNTSVSLPNYPATYNPQGFWKAYDASNAPAATRTNIAIFAEGDVSQVVTDLRAEETANGLPQVQVQVVPTGIASTDISGLDEWDMDTQYSTGMADMSSKSTLYIYDATSLTDSDIALEFNRFVADDKAVAGSASFGECEAAPYADGAMLADDEVFAEAAAQGQTIFASSGDTGGACAVAPTNGVPMSGPPEVNYPASSPYVVAVGGTTLITNSDGSYNTELAWVGGGGGTSALETAPYWQASADPASTAGKGVPDIAMDADPYSGANVWMNGVEQQGYGGTSLASPLALGSWARMEAAANNKLGFAAPLLYQQYQTAGFHDITLGDTGPYPATPGWDFATGLGTFDVATMARQLSQR